ncbi:5-formyltetrahydrofolate cyclo-ligase [Roseivirga sp. UBA1976]|uniref:5-formyltetrahydrofolate cyclo-ligase n=1 Tax=Roseivirga sp. UBA1976 TaxID=1947386 RepID=UPI00257FA454|nr:5-formyltetrahydrofolate cyclo-ligase [Roseivirga sp. UBA1976]MEC7754252.1 5-formyltetrahydrofolate cyclo-ligase [Bacteroidota bacterium]|tara:strand:+ start:575 stop:1144 length:570 start_codon:yes stop_codon:yes gene_type:complete
MNKQVLRSMFLEKRLTLRPTEYALRNTLMIENCKQFLTAHSELKHVHIFGSMPTKLEPDTAPLIDWLLLEQKQVYSSKTHWKKRSLSHHPINHSADFRPDSRGIPEPTSSQEAQATLFDLVFVPLISFDESGNRIGYGAGLYDRFLAELRPECKKVGLAITPPLNTIPYADTHDIPLSACINHLGIYTF